MLSPVICKLPPQLLLRAGRLTNAGHILRWYLVQMPDYDYKISVAHWAFLMTLQYEECSCASFRRVVWSYVRIFRCTISAHDPHKRTKDPPPRPVRSWHCSCNRCVKRLPWNHWTLDERVIVLMYAHLKNTPAQLYTLLLPSDLSRIPHLVCVWWSPDSPPDSRWWGKQG